MSIEFKVPERKMARIIIDTDASCECDDQYAIVHSLCSPKVDVRGIIAAHYGTRQAHTMECSYEEIIRLCRLMDISENIARRGAAGPLENEKCAADGEGIDLILEEAMREDARPLFVLCQGPLTNAASAILKNPEICRKIVLICVAGINYPYGGFEFNTLNDYQAFNVVMDSAAPVWMIPEEVYGTMLVSFYELLDKVYPYGLTGKYLVENTFRAAEEMIHKIPETAKESRHDAVVSFPAGESWSLGDSTALGLVLNAGCGKYHYVKAPKVRPDGTYTLKEDSKMIRWYDFIDSRFILEDFFAKIKRRVLWEQKK